MRFTLPTLANRTPAAFAQTAHHAFALRWQPKLFNTQYPNTPDHQTPLLIRSRTKASRHRRPKVMSPQHSPMLPLRQTPALPVREHAPNAAPTPTARSSASPWLPLAPSPAMPAVAVARTPVHRLAAAARGPRDPEHNLTLPKVLSSPAQTHIPHYRGIQVTRERRARWQDGWGNCCQCLCLMRRRERRLWRSM